MRFKKRRKKRQKFSYRMSVNSSGLLEYILLYKTWTLSDRLVYNAYNSSITFCIEHMYIQNKYFCCVYCLHVYQVDFLNSYHCIVSCLCICNVWTSNFSKCGFLSTIMFYLNVSIIKKISILLCLKLLSVGTYTK